MKDFANRNARRKNRRVSAHTDSSDRFFSNHQRDHKTAQLCQQVFQALSLALSECGDDLLRDLVLHDVQPAPNPSRLLARVSFSTWANDRPGAAEVLQRLGEASGFLRHQVAAAITRKRAPEIFFALIASGEEMP